MTIDQSKEEFEKFKDEWNKFKELDLTEADTRSKLIDFLFIKVLGWEEDNIDREKYVQIGYYDYLVSIPGFQFVLEAKKSFVDFVLPTKHRSSTISSLLKGNKEVIEQIRNYMFEVGVQYGVISNGRQFIAGKFINIDGSDWKKNKCIIFNGVNELDERFIEFFNFLSKKAVVEHGTLLTEESKEEIGKTIYSSLTDKNGEIVRNSLSSELTPVLDKVFGEIYKYEVLDNEDLIKECFIENKEIKKNKSDIEKLFGDKPPKLGEVSSARNTQSIVEQISEELKSQPIGLKDIEPPKPILVIGSKGAGKTTFINYLFKSAIDNKTLKNRPYVYIDFRKYVDEDFVSIDANIYEDIISKIHDDYDTLQLYSVEVLKRIYFKEIKERQERWRLENDEKSYNRELQIFLDERTKDYENHFIKLSHYFLSQRNIRLTLVIDNADQFDIPIQKKVFLLAHSLNRKAKCAIILSLREGYYYEWRNKPPFDAFVNNVYHVTAPPYSEVLQKRIDYALKNITIEGKSKGVLGKATFEVSNEAVRDFLLGLKKSLFSQNNSDILKFLQETTYPNLREGLRVFRDFLLSGHTEVSEYILRQRVSPESIETIPFWEFLKAIALLNKKYYNHQLSSIHNIFHPAEGNNFQFLKIQILKFLLERIEKYGQAEKFIQTSSLLDDFIERGYKFVTILGELNQLLEYRLIETDDILSDKEFNTQLTNHKSISISLKGRYYVQTITTKFEYMELCLQDTPIYNDDFFDKIRKSFPLADENGKRSLSGRYENILQFIEYLEYREHQELNSNVIISEAKIKGLSSGLERINKRIEKLRTTMHQRP